MAQIYEALLQKSDEQIEVSGVGDIAWTRTFEFKGNPSSEYAAEFTFNSVSGDPKVRIELEVSNAKLSEDEQYLVNTAYVIARRDTPIGDVTDELRNYFGYNPVPAKYGRYKLTGITGNPSDTKLVRGRHIGVE